MRQQGRESRGCLDHGAAVVGRGAKRGRAGAGPCRGLQLHLGGVPYSGAGGARQGELCQVTPWRRELRNTSININNLSSFLLSFNDSMWGNFHLKHQLHHHFPWFTGQIIDWFKTVAIRIKMLVPGSWEQTRVTWRGLVTSWGACWPGTGTPGPHWDSLAF